MSPLLHPQGTEYLPMGENMSNVLAAEGSVTETRRTVETGAEVIELDGERYLRHRNGGGLIAVIAIVGRGVYVAPRAIIRGRAVVVGAVRLFDEAVVEESAIVAGCCTLRNHASVGGEAVLRGNVLLADVARVDGVARVSGSVKLRHFAHVSNGTFSGGITIS